MKSFNVTLVLLSDHTSKVVVVKATNAVNACDVAQSLNPGTVANQADIVVSA